QGDALAIGAGDWLTLGERVMHETVVGGDLRRRLVEFAPTQGGEKVAGKNHALALAPGETFFDQVLGTRRHCSLNICSETRTGNCGIAYQQLPVDPGRTARRYLC